MKTVHKYPILFGVPYPINIQETDKPVHFDMQNGTPTLWVEVEKDVSTSNYRTFKLYGTGYPIDDNSIYIGTCFYNTLVWHLYEVIE